MPHIPAWIIKALAAIGGWNLFEKLIVPMLKLAYQKITARHDEPVWIVVRQPKYKQFPSSQNWVVTPEVELPYTVQEIANRTGRSESSVTSSLKRLEKRGKVKDVHGGWKRT
jgi:predicted Rossmann fold nucleotide-binding protein DprA/Smf involved in DNA uptake